MCCRAVSVSGSRHVLTMDLQDLRDSLGGGKQRHVVDATGVGHAVLAPVHLELQRALDGERPPRCVHLHGAFREKRSRGETNSERLSAIPPMSTQAESNGPQNGWIYDEGIFAVWAIVFVFGGWYYCYLFIYLACFQPRWMKPQKTQSNYSPGMPGIHFNIFSLLGDPTFVMSPIYGGGREFNIKKTSLWAQ